MFALVFACLRHVRKRQRSQKRKRRRRSVSPPLHAIACHVICFFRSICSCRSLLHSGWSSVYIYSLLGGKFLNSVFGGIRYTFSYILGSRSNSNPFDHLTPLHLTPLHHQHVFFMGVTFSTVVGYEALKRKRFGASVSRTGIRTALPQFGSWRGLS